MCAKKLSPLFVNKLLNIIIQCDLQVYIMLHQPHSGIPGPALLVVVADNVLIVRIGVLCQISLDEVSSLLRREPVEQQLRNSVHIITDINNKLCTSISCRIAFYASKGCT